MNEMQGVFVSGFHDAVHKEFRFIERHRPEKERGRT